MKDDGGPAFPVPETSLESAGVFAATNQGMSLRDWFAGMALQGTAANPKFDREKWTTHAEAAYRAADAMLAARKEKQ